MSLGQFVLTHRDAQMGERCQTTEAEIANTKRDRLVRKKEDTIKKETGKTGGNLYVYTQRERHTLFLLECV